MRHLNRFSSIVLLLLSVAAVCSCVDRNNTLGTIYIPSNHDIPIKVAEFDLPVTLKLCEDIQSQSSTLMFGSITSEDYGTITVGAAASLTPTTDTADFGKDPVFIDMYLQGGISRTDFLSADQANIPQNLHVYPLTRPLDTTLIYANSIRREDIGTEEITQRDAVYMGGDSIKVHFTKEYAEQFFKATDAEIDSAQLFAKRFYGIYIETDPIEEGLIGGRINQTDIYSTIAVLVFTSTNNAGKRRDTSITFQVGSPYYVNSFSASSKGLATDYPKETLYYEGLSGVKPHVSGKVLRNMLAKWAMEEEGVDVSRIVIAKATIELPYEYADNQKDIANYPTNMFPCQKVVAEDSHFFYSPIEEIYDANVNDGTNNRSLMAYKPDAGRYVQGLLKTEANDIDELDDIWLMPTFSVTNSSTNQVVHYADFVGYEIARLNGPAAQRKPKLRITYSVLR